jgi:hypothetical protein
MPKAIRSRSTDARKAPAPPRLRARGVWCTGRAVCSSNDIDTAQDTGSAVGVRSWPEGCCTSLGRRRSDAGYLFEDNTRRATAGVTNARQPVSPTGSAKPEPASSTRPHAPCRASSCCAPGDTEAAPVTCCPRRDAASSSRTRFSGPGTDLADLLPDLLDRLGQRARTPEKPSADSVRLLRGAPQRTISAARWERRACQPQPHERCRNG